MKLITIIAAITLGFMVLDIVTGLIGAIKNKVYKSRVMREGLYHKAGYILTIALGALVEFACNYVDLGFQMPILKPIMIYIILNETGSIVENIKKINPAILPKKISDILTHHESEG